MDPEFLDHFRKTVDDSTRQLLAYSDAEAARHPAAGKWSRKEIIGHLIDSACHNHGRFVRAQLQDDLVFPGYDQEAWVRIQQYQHCTWPDLVRLWQAYNHHIIAVMATASAEALHRPRVRHNLDQLAWKPVSASEPVTLDFFMRDYVEHLEHHVRQTAGW